MYIWAVDDLYIHNFKAIGCVNPKQTLKKQNSSLWNRMQRVLNEEKCDQTNIEYIDWFNVVTKSSVYQACINIIMCQCGRVSNNPGSDNAGQNDLHTLSQEISSPGCRCNIGCVRKNFFGQTITLTVLSFLA